MSIWTLADIFIWTAVAGAYVLIATALLTAAWLICRLGEWYVRLLLRLWARMQGSPLADPPDDDVSDEHDYADEHAEMQYRARLIEDAPLIPTQHGPKDSTYRALEVLYQQPARTEENQ